MTEPGPVVWLLTDNKPGHRSQLEGLARRLEHHAGACCHWITATAVHTPLWRAVLGRARQPAYPTPGLIIAAGSGTHRLLLGVRRLAPTVVLMKPGFPISLVDAVITPRHDRPRPRRNLLQTTGTLNAMEPQPSLTRCKRVLVLIGGPSRHFEWNEDQVATQLQHLIESHPQWQWTISDSRRTPSTATARLKQLCNTTVTLVTHDQTEPGWLARELTRTRFVWVTPDSSTMVSEAVTAGVPTALFTLPPRPGSRVASGIDDMQDEGLAMSWQAGLATMNQSDPSRPQLWEADRAARWLLSRGLLPAGAGTPGKRPTTPGGQHKSNVNPHQSGDEAQ